MTDDLTKRIEAALNDSEFPCARCQHCDRQVDAVMAVIADQGHADACVHPDQHAAVIREWEDAKAEVERLRTDLTTAQGQVADYRAANKGMADERAELKADVGMWTNFCRDQRQRAEQAEALAADCTCGTPGLDYEGPQADCAVHGAIRALAKAHADTRLMTEMRDFHMRARDQWRRRAEQAEEAIERVRALHTSEQYHDELLPWCTYCNRDDNQRDDVVLWPCPTLRAFDGPLPPDEPHGEPS